MSNRNATASWSGYSHQGKVGILVALRKINELNLELDQNCILDYEQQEDVRLLIDDETNIIEVHQVKARISGTTIGTYTDALRNFEYCEGDNFIHTIVDVHNWDNLTEEQNPQNVTRYDYGNNELFCSLDQITNKIIREINNILQEENHLHADNDDYHKKIYDFLLGELDDRIRESHHKQDYYPQFKLDEILEVVVNPPQERKSSLYAYRQSLYKEFEEYILDLDSTGKAIEKSHLSNIRSKIEQIYYLPDTEFEQFLRNINPHTTSGAKINDVPVAKFFNDSNFSQVFLEVLQDVEVKELEINKDHVPNYFKENFYVLTTINDGDRRKSSHARRIAMNREVDFSEFETDYLITENYSGKVSALAIMDERSDPQKFQNPKKMSFIPKSEAKRNLNN